MDLEVYVGDGATYGYVKQRADEKTETTAPYVM